MKKKESTVESVYIAGAGTTRHERVEEERKGSSLPAKKMKARTVVGREGKEEPAINTM